ncbi:anhydro-N-acetylmuramic acid kinase [Variovorax guangxiensis]|uniref:Anhydro-N-acetylmuramic acid kinase n=1 Tax=Variovorax guangxiensis TaxID=1775474 RepID=A0A502DKI8_9BURK|nr:anhydro-N-acetylmuramic acid kinase [Variovorax guangxiensis]RZI65758.1 MAG: anhydro-N-acetylmuramic acid kinase [Variovorax sp.]TPG21233.1 anhydro-N-acetylmuramic acid kinase [Variovorax ginsengisoli]TPG25282.1 anhydro-N-acetylmuramic acid kinase [Variovorax guangxiensis]
MAELFIGLMSGTSLDGVDGVLADFANERMTVLAHASAAFPAALRTELLALNTTGHDELHRAALAANGLVTVYAAVVRSLLADTGLSVDSISAIGAHGQTVRHRPGEFDGIGYTLQLDNPALLAEWSGIDVVADFRRRDVAAGGQGAPLVPAFHRAVFGRADLTVAVLNLGGIANLSVLPAADTDAPVLGFDCGPGNALMDHWCHACTGRPFDEGGRWAASGHVLPDLLARLRAEPFLAKPPPKSTGRDLFHPKWLQTMLADTLYAPADVQATLTEFTASVCADHLRRYGIDSRELVVCGGGALNNHLMDRLAALLPGVEVVSSADRGLPPQQVEAAAFAWLARATLRREPGNLASATGARGERVLGAIYPA